MFPILAAAIIASGIPALSLSPVLAVENDAGTAASLFDSLKDKYEDLSNQFGDISAPNSDAFNNYLKGIQSNKDSLDFDKSLNEIKNFDYSTTNNTYINEIINAAKQNSASIKNDSEELSKAFEQKYAQAEKDAADAKANTEAKGQKEYNESMDEYNAAKNQNDAVKAQAQGLYSSYLDRYHSAVSGGGDLSGNFKKYDLPKFDDELLEYLASEVGITTPKVEAATQKKAKKAVKQLTKEKTSVTKTQNKLYTSNAYMHG